MKNPVLYTLVLAAIASATPLSAFSGDAKKKITVRAAGKGPDGYNDVREKHSGDTHTLQLSGAGYESGAWMHPPQINNGETSLQELEAAVRAAMAKPGASGTFEWNGNVKVEWKRLQDGFEYTIVDR